MDKIFLLFLLGIVAAGALTYLGWIRLLVVKTGSMEPAVPVNSLLLVIPKESAFNQKAVYQIGEIVSFRPEGSRALITHRVVSVAEENGQIFYKTKGDANESSDPKPVSQEMVVGKTAISFLGIGRLASFLNTFWGLFFIVILPASFVILHEVLIIQEELKKIESVRVSKKTIVGPLAVIIFLALAAPVFGLFSSSVFLEGNSLSTKETFIADHLVINEVYYQVDTNHGKDVLGGSGTNSASNSDTGADSKNVSKVVSSSSCSVNQSNSSSVNNNININVDTGGNSANGNTGNGSVSSGSATASASVSSNGNTNSASCSNGHSDEWVEIYNPTDHDISLKNWGLTDNSGKLVKINANKTIKAGGFALISKSSSTWTFWNEDPDAVKIALGSIFGDGLDNSGDRLILKDPSGNVVDELSYGFDVSIFDPSISLVPLGSSFERTSAGFDSDTAADFVPRIHPTPGY